MSDFVDGLRSGAAAALFPTEGTLSLAGLDAPVEVGRDAWGVPYLAAESPDDLWFAQGAFTAGERLFQIDLLLRAANGRLSEVFAERTLPDDRFARTVGFHRAGAKMAARWTARDRTMHGRFREGVFAWIEAMPAPPVEYALLDLRPELPEDEGAWAAAFSYLAWGLSGNWDKELLRAWIRERAGDDAVATLMPSPSTDHPAVSPGAHFGAVFDALPRTPGQGSNAWVVSGTHAAGGKPLLANDPHLPAIQPGPWIECHLSAPGYRARGVALIFSPGVLLGTTAHHAWGVTNVTGDTQDLYVERLDDARTSAAHGDAWEPLQIHHETIMVRGSDPQTLDVRETRHGPLLETFVSGFEDPEYIALPDEPAYALCWVGADGAGIRPSLALDAANARSFEGFRAAVLQIESPGQNFVYADTDGTIGYACTGRFPVRRGGDGTAPVAGWDDDHDWDGDIPADELPWAADPARGFLVTANHRVHDDTYPHLIGHDFHASLRARRIAELLDVDGPQDVNAMAALQNDTVSLAARVTLPLLLTLEAGTEDETRALDLLRPWDGDMAAASVPAAVFTVWCRHIARRALTPRLGEDLFHHYYAEREVFQCDVLPSLLADRPSGWLDDALLHDALADTLEELRATLGDDPASWRWGALHRLVLTGTLGRIPGLESLFGAVDAELGGDEQTVMQGGFDGRHGYRTATIASWRAVYDLGDLDRSVGVLPSGVSGNPASPHWNDQSPLWLRGATHPLPFTEDAVEAATVSRIRLVPR